MMIMMVVMAVIMVMVMLVMVVMGMRCWYNPLGEGKGPVLLRTLICQVLCQLFYNQVSTS